jgi:colanic acid biosynthesis glycosyl transferase WcaI
VRIIFLNQYFPPDPAPTGLLFGEIAEALRARGHEVICVASGQSYRDGQRAAVRFLRESWALVRMFFRAVWLRRADVVVSGSSPPCLAVVAGLVALRHWAPHVHWCMDLYPEIAVALREIRDGKVAWFIRLLMRLAYRRAYTVIGLDADMVETLARYGVEPQECRPWVPAPVLAARPHAGIAPGEPWTWLYSGNLGRAHDWQTLLAAQAELEAHGVDAMLVFQGGGPSWPVAQARAHELGLRRIEWRPYAPESDLCTALLHAQVVVATELPEVRGLLWPSKLALLLGLPRRILFVGPKDCAIARLLTLRTGSGVLTSGDFAAVARWIENQRSAEVADSAITDIVAHRQQSLDWWVASLERLARR